jgi:filamentous hemagglutinin family protein
MHSSALLNRPLFTALLCLLTILHARAEVTADGSLGGAPGSVVGAGNGYTYDIGAPLGQTQGANLFHSFSTFNIDTGEHANFSGPASVAHIIARVTGGETSNVAGRVSSSINGASLWLANPNGFLFTNGAVIDVGGSVNISTHSFRPHQRCLPALYKASAFSVARRDQSLSTAVARRRVAPRRSATTLTSIVALSYSINSIWWPKKFRSIWVMLASAISTSIKPA